MSARAASASQPRAQEERLTLGEAAVISVEQAARLLPISDGEAREWLATEHLIHLIRGRRVVIWGEVVAAIRGGANPTAPKPPRARSRTLPWRDPG